VDGGAVVQGDKSNILVTPFGSYPAFCLHGNAGLHFEKVNNSGA
jgi:hypothetical protein